MTDQNDHDQLNDRRRALEKALARHAPSVKDKGAGNDSGKFGGAAQALKLSSEFVAGIIVGVGLGWFVDRMAGSSPWGLIVGLLLGFAAGTLNVLRSAGKIADVGSVKPGKGEDGL